MGTKKLGLKSYVGMGFLGVLVLVVLFNLGKIVETVSKGTYQVKQAAITGEMSAKMTPGMWAQMWGDIDPWPKEETFFFTAEKDTAEDVDLDNSIEVRFNDGSMGKISGTVRIILPKTEQEAISLVTDRSHKTYLDLEQKLIKPTVRNVLRSTANLMTARESYSEKRLDFISMARDQILNGVYKTKEQTKEVEDLVTGEKIWKKIKVVRKDADGNVMYEANPMANTGIELANFEIKEFKYEKKVQEQIAEQQKARMAVETAKARAEQAKQLEQQTVAEGKQKVAQAKYDKEQEKIRAVVDAEKEKEVMELAAERDKNVRVIEGEKLKAYAKLEKEAAELQKAKNILEGQGLAEKRKLILASDGALKQKLETFERVQKFWADAYASRKVPSYYMAGTGTGENGAVSGDLDYGTKMFQQNMNLLLLKNLGLDMTIKEGTKMDSQ